MNPLLELELELEIELEIEPEQKWLPTYQIRLLSSVVQVAVQVEVHD